MEIFKIVEKKNGQMILELNGKQIDFIIEIMKEVQKIKPSFSNLQCVGADAIMRVLKSYKVFSKCEKALEA
jgi:hypothetical protein